jgi:hypothetical protein
MNIQALKQNLNNIMPLLTANLAAANRDHMAGKIAAGAFHYVRSRHETACAVIARDDLDAEHAYKACALLAIDLRHATEDFAEGDTSLEKAWWQCYREAGFTEVNKFFNAPMLPAQDFKAAS